jgi:hypothetical protein
LFLRYFTYLDDGNPAYGPDKCINIGAMELRLEHVGASSLIPRIAHDTIHARTAHTALTTPDSHRCKK